MWRGPTLSTGQRGTTPRTIARTIDRSTLAISVTNGSYHHNATYNTSANGNTRSINASTLTVDDTGNNNTGYIAQSTLTFGNIHHNAPTVGITSSPSTQQTTYDTLAII